MPNALILMASTTKREYLRQLVSDKNRWSRALTAEEKALGFLGWHERGYLPHCDFPGLGQFVTYRLDDSMPASRRGEWEHLLKIEDVRQRRAQLEKYLDRGIGKCFLRQAKIAEIVESSLLHFHGELYDLLAWCVMPNHVHVLVHVWETPLWKIIAAWKKASSARALKLLRAEHRFPDRRDSKTSNAPIRRAALQWQREYWDTFMRNEDQQRKAIHYIETNPMKALLCRAPEDWPFSSAKLRDEFCQLEIPEEAVHA